jgi:hypothetical protein
MEQGGGRRALVHFMGDGFRLLSRANYLVRSREIDCLSFGASMRFVGLKLRNLNP